MSGSDAKQASVKRLVIRVWFALLLFWLAACSAAQPPVTPTTSQAQARPPDPTATPSAPPPTAAPSATPVPPTAAPSATPVPPTVAPSATPVPPTVAPSATPVPPTVAPSSVPSPLEGVGAEILFLRGGKLLAYDLQGKQERLIAEGVRDFAATPDGRRLALVRGTGPQSELWLIERDGGGLRQLTGNRLVEDGPRWMPDGQSLVYTAAAAALARPVDWQGWSDWCSGAEVRALDLISGNERRIAPGCDPAVAPDGRRIALATPPETQPLQLDFLGATNAIRIVNRQGLNGWSLASFDDEPLPGLLVYGPAWSPDGSEVAYQRFLGYQALVDINLTEVADSFRGEAALAISGAGWMLAPQFSRDGRILAVIDHNFSDARGFSGYDIWNLALLRLDTPDTILLPSGEYPANATLIDNLNRVTAAAWSPVADQLAVVLPAGWQPGLSNQEPAFPQAGPGEIWLWQPGSAPERRLVAEVDFGSPLAWLPPPLRTWAAGELRLAAPADWMLSTPADSFGIGAVDPSGKRLLLVRTLEDTAALNTLFPDLLASGLDESESYTLPDGSSMRSFRGQTPQGTEVGGMVRLVAERGTTRALLYRTPAANWPYERALALALLAGGER